MGSVPTAYLPLAVHISDGILTVPWLAGGFVVAGLLALLAAYRVRDEEVPRIALLTAAFFVASLIHVRLGPTSVHLLLNGLVGVLLGRRAPLAVLVGLFLQAALLGHGGFTTLGVNACVLGVPALLAGGLFALLHRLPWLRHPWFRGGLVAVSALAWVLSLVFSAALLATNRWTALPSLDPGPAVRLTLHPATLAAACLLALAAVWAERRLDNAPEFPLGLLIGVLAVLLTLALNAIVLLWGGAEDWHTIVLLVFVAHMPIVVIEGIVLGFAVGFLARVKPEVLGSYRVDQPAEASRNGTPHTANGVNVASRQEVRAPSTLRPPALLLAVLTLLLTGRPAQAHRLEAEYRVLPDRRVQIESWFDLTGDSPAGAPVTVYRADHSVLASGKLDDKGLFVFPFARPEELRVVVSAGAGHRKELTIPAAELAAVFWRKTACVVAACLASDANGWGAMAVLHEYAHPVSAPATSIAGTSPGTETTGGPRADRSPRVTVKDVLIGVGFLLAVGAFVLSLRNARQLRGLTKPSRQE